jgi:cytochrome c2
MKKLFLTTLAFTLLIACGKKEKETEEYNPAADPTATEAAKDPASYDPKRGEGKFTTVELGATLDQAMATKGEEVASVKCTSCHKITDEKLVGPGWKGVTSRKKTGMDYEFHYQSGSND